MTNIEPELLVGWVSLHISLISRMYVRNRERRELCRLTFMRDDNEFKWLTVRPTQVDTNTTTFYTISHATPLL